MMWSGQTDTQFTLARFARGSTAGRWHATSSRGACLSRPTLKCATGLIGHPVPVSRRPCRLAPERIEEALQFYAGLFDDAAFELLERYGPEGPGAEGTVMHARLRIGDQAFMAFDSPPLHAFGLTPSLSLGFRGAG